MLKKTSYFDLRGNLRLQKIRKMDQEIYGWYRQEIFFIGQNKH